MLTKRWRLVVTDLGGTAPLSEVIVEAPNWMAALQVGRARVGEEAQVPRGASCAVAPDGKVSIHDPLGRRTYVVTPDTSSSFTPSSRPRGPSVPAESVPRKPAGSGTLPLQSARPSSAPKTTEPPVDKNAARKSYRPPRPSSPPRVSREASSSEVGDRTERVPMEVVERVEAMAAKPVEAPPEAETMKRPSTTSKAPQPVAVSARGEELLQERNEDPSDASPLHYRERSYYLPEGTGLDVAEALLRDHLAVLQVELESAPAGKFINLAVFDHSWTEKPSRAPIATLQWKDWRGDPEINFPKPSKRPPSKRPSRASGAKPRGTTAGLNLPKADAGTSEIDLRLGQAFESAQDLLFLKTPAEALDFVIRLLGDLVPSEAASACLYDINNNEFRVVAVDGPGAEKTKGRAVPAETGIFGHAMHQEVPLRVEDAEADERFVAAVDGRKGVETQNLLYMPLSHQGRLLGMLHLINRRRHRAFSAEDASVVAYIGEQLTQFLHKDRIADKTSRPPEPRKG